MKTINIQIVDESTMDALIIALVKNSYTVSLTRQDGISNRFVTFKVFDSDVLSND
jgi:hypothetical protein